MSHEADKIYERYEHEIEEEAITLEAELADAGAGAERDKYAASLAVARAWLQIQANRKGSLLFTSELRKAAEIALEIIADPELCLKAHDEARDKEKDYQIRQLRNVLAEAGRQLSRQAIPTKSAYQSAREIAIFLGYEGSFSWEAVDAFLSSVSVGEPDA